MTTQEALQLLKELSSLYPNTITKESSVVWCNTIMTFPYDVGRIAVTEYPKLGYEFFNIGKFCKLCDDIWSDFISKKRAREQEDNREAVKLLFHTPLESISASEIAKDSLRLIRNHLEGKTTRKEYLIGIRKLEEKYPNISPYSFADSANELEQFYKITGLDYGNKPVTEEEKDIAKDEVVDTEEEKRLAARKQELLEQARKLEECPF